MRVQLPKGTELSSVKCSSQIEQDICSGAKKDLIEPIGINILCKIRNIEKLFRLFKDFIV